MVEMLADSRLWWPTPTWGAGTPPGTLPTSSHRSSCSCNAPTVHSATQVLLHSRTKSAHGSCSCARVMTVTLRGWFAWFQAKQVSSLCLLVRLGAIESEATYPSKTAQKCNEVPHCFYCCIQRKCHLCQTSSKLRKMPISGFHTSIEVAHSLVGHKHSMKTDEPGWLNLELNGPSTNHMSSKYSIVWAPQDLKQRMNTVYILSPCINIKEDEDTYAFNRKFVQNSSRRLEEWGGVDSLHWIFMGWHLCSSL
jgi:hypothetical protein